MSSALFPGRLRPPTVLFKESLFLLSEGLVGLVVVNLIFVLEFVVVNLDHALIVIMLSLILPAGPLL